MRAVVLVGLVGLVGLFMAGPADASHMWRDSEARWRHMHTQRFVIDMRGINDPGYRYWLPRMAAEWSRGTGLSVTTRDGPGNILALDDHYGVDALIGTASLAWHGSSATVRFNLDRAHGDSLWRPALERTIARLACHELGHALGLGHGGDGCMNNESPCAGRFTLVCGPGTHDRAQLASAYGGRH